MLGTLKGAQSQGQLWVKANIIPVEHGAIVWLFGPSFFSGNQKGLLLGCSLLEPHLTSERYSIKTMIKETFKQGAKMKNVVVAVIVVVVAIVAITGTIS